jgi:hypothetical protein
MWEHRKRIDWESYSGAPCRNQLHIVEIRMVRYLLVWHLSAYVLFSSNNVFEFLINCCGKQGYGLLCVGFPLSDIEVETQDEDEVISTPIQTSQVHILH